MLRLKISPVNYPKMTKMEIGLRWFSCFALNPAVPNKFLG
jgi:hypothetical protein